MIEYCECSDVCQRWGIYDDGSGGFFCPYVPGSKNTCKKLSDELGKDIKPLKQNPLFNPKATDSPQLTIFIEGDGGFANEISVWLQEDLGLEFGTDFYWWVEIESLFENKIKFQFQFFGDQEKASSITTMLLLRFQ